MIVAAAIKFYIENSKNEVVLCGVRHGDIYKQLQGLGFKPHIGYKEICQGFVSNTGEFMNREDSYRHAVISGQIEEKLSPELFSEDLW